MGIGLSFRVTKNTLMKRILSIAFFAVALSGMMASSCGKGGGGGEPEPPAEQNLVITTTPANGSVSPAAAQESFTVSIRVDSQMPSQGVKIEVSSAPESGGASFFTQTLTPVSTATSTVTITGTPVQQSCIATIKVSSIAKPSNTATSSFRYSRK